MQPVEAKGLPYRKKDNRKIAWTEMAESTHQQQYIIHIGTSMPKSVKQRRKIQQEHNGENLILKPQ